MLQANHPCDTWVTLSNRSLDFDAGMSFVKRIASFWMKKSVTMCAEQYSMKAILAWSPSNLVANL